MFNHPPPPPERQRRAQPAADPGSPPGNQDALIAYIAECLARGSSPGEVQKQLIALGYSADDSKRLVESVQPEANRFRSLGAAPGFEDARAIGKRNMTIGAIVCVVGLVITFGSMAASSGSGGGFVVAWGAIIFGAIQFFRGAAQAGDSGSQGR